MKNRIIPVMFLVVSLLGVATPHNALAHWRGHSRHDHIGVYIDPFPVWRYYPPPYYDYPPPVYITPPTPPVYIERAPAQSYWYYCTEPQGYYPTVRECPGGWLKVLPQP